jgi:hypothetical protein
MISPREGRRLLTRPALFDVHPATISLLLFPGDPTVLETEVKGGKRPTVPPNKPSNLVLEMAPGVSRHLFIVSLEYSPGGLRGSLCNADNRFRTRQVSAIRGSYSFGKRQAAWAAPPNDRSWRPEGLPTIYRLRLAPRRHQRRG